MTMAIAAYKPKLSIVADGNDELADLCLIQGLWTPEQYLRLTDYSRRFIEFTDGKIEVLPMPTRRHQAISRFLFRLLDALMQQTGGTVFYAELRLQIRADKFREPDLLLLLD